MKSCTSQCPTCGCDTRSLATADDYGIALDPPEAWLRMRGLEDNSSDDSEEVA